MNRPGEQTTETREEYGAGPMLCGVPVLWLEALARKLDRETKREWNKILAVLVAYQEQVENYAEDEAEEAYYRKIDEEEPDPTQAYRKKLKYAVTKIKPSLMRKNIEFGLLTGNPLAARQLSDIMALPTEAKSKAIDDRPPGITFIDEGMEDEDDE